MYLIPLFNLYIRTGLYDTWLGMALFYTSIAIPFCLFVMHGFFSTIPQEVQDAARLDGASDFRIYWRIFMPLAWGPIAVAPALPVHVDLERPPLRARAVDVGRGAADHAQPGRTPGRVREQRAAGRAGRCADRVVADDPPVPRPRPLPARAGSCSRRDADDGHAAGDARAAAAERAGRVALPERDVESGPREELRRGVGGAELAVPRSVAPRRVSAASAPPGRRTRAGCSHRRRGRARARAGAARAARCRPGRLSSVQAAIAPAVCARGARAADGCA